VASEFVIVAPELLDAPTIYVDRQCVAKFAIWVRGTDIMAFSCLAFIISRFAIES